MKALLQRVKQAQVHVNGKLVGAIDQGVLLFLGVEKADSPKVADRVLDKVLAYRIFPDEQDKMNLSLQDIQGGLLVVSQFTLVADTRKGLRPSFSSAAAPDLGKEIYDYFVQQAEARHPLVSTGEYAADMAVSLINDGPVTFMLDVKPS